MDKEKRVLLLNIDVQNDFATGALGTPEAAAALPTIRKVNVYAIEKGYDRGATMDTHEYETYMDTQEGKFLPVLHTVYRTKGWMLCKELMVEGDPQMEFCICKNAFGSLEWLNGILYDDEGNCKYDEIWIIGFCTDICVIANFQILKALFPEIPIIIISDACAGVTPELHEAALKVMKSCQAIVLTYDELIERENENEA